MGICGPNGSGKTNLLDAVYYLGFSRSYFSRPDSQQVQHGMQGMRIHGSYELNGEPTTVTAILRESGKKELQVDGDTYRKFSDHIGRFPVVMIAPDDVSLISGPGEDRRKFIDTILSQLNATYLKQLIDHNKLLQQRNSLLKAQAETGQLDASLMAIISDQLCVSATYLFQERKEFLELFIPQVINIYERIAEQHDDITLQYESQLLNNTMSQLLERNTQKDSILQRTSGGIHRDDLLIKMGEQAFRSDASQGQRKSLLFALKLAEWQILATRKGFTPILLLDDVFEKLDDQRMTHLLQWVCGETDGQVLITDTHPERLKQQLSALSIEHGLIEVKRG
jgi:DNA replication and repair protein RecF